MHSYSSTYIGTYFWVDETVGEGTIFLDETVGEGTIFLDETVGEGTIFLDETVGEGTIFLNETVGEGTICLDETVGEGTLGASLFFSTLRGKINVFIEQVFIQGGGRLGLPPPEKE